MAYLKFKQFKPLKIISLLLVNFCLLSGCYTNPFYNPKKTHHTEDGFQNNIPQESPGFTDFVKFAWLSLTEDYKTLEYPLEETDTAFLKTNRKQSTLTWIGHATLLLQYEGVNILTDPHFTEMASPVPIGPSRYTPPAIDFSDLPPIDIVIISHNHYDHLDLETVETLHDLQGDRIRWYVPLGLKEWFADLGVTNVHEKDWWDMETWKQLTIHSVPLQHFSARSLFDRNETLWAGWVIEFPGFKFFFAGDTGYSPDFKEIGKRLGPIDLSAIPIGAYDPRSFMKPIHVNPEEAVMIHRDVQSRYSVGIHWGTFQLTTDDMDEPPKRLKANLEKEGISEDRFFVLKHGETRSLSFLDK